MIETVTIEETKEIEQPVAKICDKCKRRATTDVNNENGLFEWQEFHHIRFVGGYGSVFGDEARVECDLCQHCLKEMIESFCRIQSI